MKQQYHGAPHGIIIDHYKLIDISPTQFESVGRRIGRSKTVRNCINFIDNGEEDDLRTRLLAPANDLGQDLYVSGELKTSRVMVKDENVCLHCGLCAERCPTAAWDMSKFTYNVTKAGN